LNWKLNWIENVKHLVSLKNFGYSLEINNSTF